MFVLALVIFLIIVITAFYILSNSTRYYDKTGFRKFSSIWRDECKNAKMRNENPDKYMATYIYAMSLFNNDITVCDFLLSEIERNGASLLYIEVLKNHEISDLELKKLKNVAEVYPFDPQLVLFMYLKTKSHGNLASKYAYDLLSVKFKPWFYRIKQHN
ncbi:hypothetical protein LI139_05120 [Veillonella atypica]|uniref:hypothetical protein n=1 Tax=Veillonella atypica TaxID=39777 RepID=UPI001D07CF6B|nr:hypothetical protein [Veillonella atypica]MCB6515027.1 hypothetical protein [Veillonella atypica]MCG4862601.1 hypothetical protein [Veillonella atypica]